MNILNNTRLVCIVFVLLSLPANAAFASDSGISVSVRLMGGGWSGKNKTSGTDFKSDDGGQAGLNVAYQNGNFYTGLNLQGGEYTFEKDTPDQVSRAGTTGITNDKISHSELDLVFGYYLTRYFSLFFAIKGVSDTWESNQHKQEFGGVGLGAAGFWPITTDWTLYGSIGAVPSGDIKTNGEVIGEGKSSALDIGAQYHFSGGHRLTFGVKRSNYVYKYDSGDEQTHSIGGIYAGYTYAFSLE